MRLRRYRVCSPVYVSENYSTVCFFSLKSALKVFTHCKVGYSLEEWTGGRWININIIRS